MDTKELYDLAQAANTCANVAITLGPKCVTVVWHGDRSVHGTTNPNWYGSRHTRELPWTALGDDRDPYRAVREYMKMDAFYMEGIGGIPDRTHDVFTSTAPAFKPAKGPKLPPIRNARVSFVQLRSPYLSLSSADLRSGDVVKATGNFADKTVDMVVPVENGFLVHWLSGGSTRYGHLHVHEVVRS